MARKQETLDDDDLAQRVNEKFEAHIAAIEEGRKQETAEIIALEKGGHRRAVPSTEKVELQELVRSYQNGFAAPEVAVLNGNERLNQLYMQREARDLAIENSRTLQRQNAVALIAVAIAHDERRKRPVLQQMRMHAEALVELELRLIASTKLATEEAKGFLSPVAVPFSGVEISSLLQEFLESCDAQHILAAKDG